MFDRFGCSGFIGGLGILKKMLATAVIATALVGCEQTSENSCADALEVLRADINSQNENIASNSGFRLRTLTDVTDPLIIQDVDYGQICQATLHWNYNSGSVTAPVEYETNTSGSGVRIVSSKWF